MKTTDTRETDIAADLAGIAEYLVDAVNAGTTSAADAAAALSEWMPGDAEEAGLSERAVRILALAAIPHTDAAIDELATVGGRR